jgi:Aspartyl protease
MTNFKWLASFVLAATIIPTLLAETHCPGNVASVPFHLINRYQMTVAVSVNHSGPYNFLLDTGTQITMVDPSLAAELHLTTQGTAAVAGTGFNASASFAQLDLLQAGDHVVTNQKVLVLDLQQLRSVDLSIRGILGEDFLEHFDMLIDTAHGLLCLDDSAAMRAEVKGQHIPLVAPAQAEGSSPLPNSLIVSARLSDGMRPVRLKLDSGTNTPFLYDPSQYLAIGLFRGASWHGRGAGGAQRAFMALPPQDVKIGSVELPKVPFLTLAGARKDSRTSDFDGLLSLGLFRRIFISHTDHFAVLDAR